MIHIERYIFKEVTFVLFAGFMTTSGIIHKTTGKMVALQPVIIKFRRFDGVAHLINIYGEKKKKGYKLGSRNLVTQDNIRGLFF